MHVNKIAKMLVGVDNIVVKDVDFDFYEDCLVIRARPTLWHSCECGECGRKASYYDAGQGVR